MEKKNPRAYWLTPGSPVGKQVKWKYKHSTGIRLFRPDYSMWTDCSELYVSNKRDFSMVVTQEVKLKNAGSWSSLASLASSQTAGASTVKKSTTAMSFELFKKAAKEKEERVCAVMLKKTLECQVKDRNSGVTY